MHDADKSKEQLIRELEALRQQHATREDALPTHRLQTAELHQLYQTAHIGLCVIDTDMRFLRINQVLADINGKSIAEHVGNTLQHVIPDIAPQIESIHRDVIASGAPCLGIEVVGETSAEPGVRRHYLGNHYPLKSAHVTVIGVGVVAEEITERLRLRASEARYRHLVDTIPHGIEDIDMSGTIVFANKALHRQYDYPEGALIGMNILDLAAGDDERESLRQRLELLAHGQLTPTPSFRRKRTKTGEVIDVEVAWNYRRDPQGHITGVTSVITDTTARKRTEEALQSSEKRFRDLVEGSIQGIVIHRDFTPLFVNQALATMFGYQTPEDILRLETIESLAAPHERARWRQYKEARLRGENAPTDFEYQAVRKDGTLIWVENKVRVVLWEDAPAIQSTAYDITVRKQTEAALQQAHDALETRVAECTADLQRLNEHLHTEITERQRAGAQVRQSHEQLRALSTRLLSIQEEERRRIAGEVHDELGQALTALKLDLAWLDRHLPGQSEPCHQKTAAMMQLLDTTIHTVRRIAATLRPRILDDLGLVAALEWQVQEFRARTAVACALTIDMEESGLDAARSTAVFRILQEALTNAARHAHATTIDVSLRTKGETLHLEVRDNGSGISDKAMRNPQSLGLFGMRERLRPWGGALNIQGSQGQGTIITVELPLDETERVR